MLASVQALLNGLIDYAGLFPPAQLPLEQALRNYAAYRQGAEAWMLGRFIVPATRLAEVSAAGGDLLGQGEPWSFSVLGRGGNTLAEFLDGLRVDLEAVRAFCRHHPGRAGVDVLEVKIPAVLMAGPQAERLYHLPKALYEALDAAAAVGLQVYCEPAPGPRWRDIAEDVAGTHVRGLKLRCGGLEAEAFPSVEQVAFLIDFCLTEEGRFKATAGLHHPIRHHDAGLNVMMHGFLNVFGSAVLAYQHALDEEQLRSILTDEDASHFNFDDAGFRWQEFAVNVEQIRSAREDFAVSFGSCSFDEPCEGLRALGLLP